MKKLTNITVISIMIAYVIACCSLAVYMAGTGKSEIEIIPSSTEETTDIIDESKLININTASIDELITLPQIGEKTAEKIIEYRNDVGKFSKITELMEVSGIGEGKFNLIKDFITV